MDLGFHSVVSRALLMHVTADQGRCRAVLEKSDNLSHIVHSMDSRADKQKFLEQHHGAFMIPKRLEFQGEEEEEVINLAGTRTFLICIVFICRLSQNY